MDKIKDFNDPAEAFFSDITQSTFNNEPTPESITFNIREQIKTERLTKRVQLTIYPTAYEQAKEKALKEGRSFNNYINELILKDLSK